MARGASSASAPSANAVSVDIAAPHAPAPSPPALKARKISTGSDAPPIAAATGTVIRPRSRSSPTSSSRLASSPTTRKKNVIRPWLIQWRRSSAIPLSPSWIDSVVVHRDS